MTRCRCPRSRRFPAAARVLVAGCLALAVLGSAAGAAAPAAADPSVLTRRSGGQQGDPTALVRYEQPAEGSVLRRFAPPASAFGAGHRGVDLAVPAGASVRAAADGTVTFAGEVVATTWVVVAHADGVVTSYGPIAGPTVGPGDPVGRGQRLGALDGRGHGVDGHDPGLHWGARFEAAYLDPLSLLASGVPRPSLVGRGAWRATAHAVDPYEPWGGAKFRGWAYHDSPDASAPGYALAPNPNHLITLSGLGSSSSSVPVPPEHLGYDLRSVTTFSYAGRDADSGAPEDPRRDQRPYDGADTWEGVDAAARRLARQLRAQAAREPGRGVDLVGHSMGGVVALHYLAHYHDPYDRTLPPIGHVVTIASPVQGSDVAALGGDVRDHSVLGRVVDAGHDWLRESDGPIGRHVGPMPLDAQAIDDLRVGSPLLDELAAAMGAAVTDGTAGSLAMGTRILTIGGGSDVVVGAGRSSLPDGDGSAGEQTSDIAAFEHRVLPGGHSRILETEAVREVVWQFLAGEEVVASPGHLSTRVSNGAGHVIRYGGLALEASDRALAPFVTEVDRR